MALFRYEATDRAGKVVRGVMNAQTEQQVEQNLAAMGYSARGIYGSGSAATAQPVATQPSATAQPAAPARPSGGMAKVTVGSGLPVSIRSRVSADTLGAFYRQFSTLIKAGMPISQAMTEMAMVTRNPHLKRTLPVFQEAVQGGRHLSTVMAEYPDVFPVHTIASIYAGEMSGRLEIALDEIASDLESEASETRYGRIGWGIAKAHILLLAVLVPASNVVSLLTPALEETLKLGDQATTADSLKFIAHTYVTTMLWKSVLAMLALIVFWIVWGHVKRIPTVKRLLDGMVLYTPIWGSLHKERALARFLHVLDGMYAAGITPAQAWDAASLTVRNSALAEKLRLARSRVSPTASVTDLFTAANVFLPEEIGMAATGEKTGRVPDVLANMSAVYDDKAAAARTRNRTISVVLLNVAIALMVIFVFYEITNSYAAFSQKAADIVGK